MSDEAKSIEEPEAAEQGGLKEVPASEKLESARQKVVEVASGMRDGAGRAGGVIREKAEIAKEKAGIASQQIREGATKASAVARERYAVARDGVREGYDKVSKDLDHLGEDVNEYVRANPGKSVLIAAGVGFLLGVLMRGRRG